MSAKGDSTRQEILETARRLFAEKGYKDVTMSLLCQETGLSRGGLYRHFESVEQIFLAVMEGFARDQGADIRAQMEREVPGPVILRGLLERYRQEMAGREDSLSLAICEYYSGHPGMEGAYAHSKAAWVELIRYGTGRGEFLPVEAEALFDLLVFAYQGVRLYSRLMELDPAVPGHITGQIQKLLLGPPPKIRLARPGPEHEAQALAFREEFFARGERVISGSERLDQIDSYGEWLAAVSRNACPETVSPDWVLTDTFFALDGEGELAGIIDLRHCLNDFLADLGNCGYSVRPSRRGRGYAGQMLRLLLEHAKAAGLPELRLSVERDNLPSVKVLQKNGGVYERSFSHQGAAADVYRFRLAAPEAPGQELAKPAPIDGER